MKYGFVTTNLLDLWSKPKFGSERVNQVLFGGLVRIGSVRSGYARVELLDGYSGWLDMSHIKETSRAAFYDHKARINAVVTVRSAKIRPVNSDHSADPFFVLYGNHLSLMSVRNGTARIALPDGSIRSMAASAVARLTGRGRTTPVSGSKIVAEARKFLGVPYLWGGITPLGFDCSGLVQAIAGRFGIDLPRDTKDQINIGQPVERNDVQTGDLLFFRRHVGLAIGKNRIIHSSVGGSGVRINSLRPGQEDYRRDLDQSFYQARRIV